jgi:hypothetical protein
VRTQTNDLGHANDYDYDYDYEMIYDYLQPETSESAPKITSSLDHIVL